MGRGDFDSGCPASGTTEDVVYLVRCVLNDTPPDYKRIASMDLDAVYKESQRCLLVAMCSTALEAAGVSDARFAQARGKAVRKVALMDWERADLFRRLDAVGIWHLPLKGCVLQDFYPSYGMRQMADNDILVDSGRMEDVRDIILSMGFSCEHFGAGSHDVYHKEPVCNFEMHRSLFDLSHDRRIYEYYRDSSKLLIVDEDGSCGRHMRDEDFYVYLVAHEYKHFSNSGIGLRALVDSYVWLREKSSSMDWAYVSAQLEELGLASFEKRNRDLAVALFSGIALNDDQQAMLAYMAESGAYGTMTHRIDNQVARYGLGGYLLRRILPPCEQMVLLYPVLDRAPVLLPVCWVWRLVHALITKPGKVMGQIKATCCVRGDRRVE